MNNINMPAVTGSLTDHVIIFCLVTFIMQNMFEKSGPSCLRSMFMYFSSTNSATTNSLNTNTVLK